MAKAKHTDLVKNHDVVFECQGCGRKAKASRLEKGECRGGAAGQHRAKKPKRWVLTCSCSMRCAKKNGRTELVEQAQAGVA